MMNHTPFHTSRIQNKQSGATLIIVLIVLVLIITIGTVAIRRSTTDLKIATAAQVNDILFQSNDAAFLKVEKEDRRLGKSAAIVDLNVYISDPERAGHSVTFCARPRNNSLFNITMISERNKDGGLLSSAGYCDPSNDDDYINEGRAITQLTFVRPIEADPEENILNQEQQGSSSNDREDAKLGSAGNPTCVKFIGYATTLIPALSSAPLGNSTSTDTTTISGCLKQATPDLVDSCLTDLGVPFTTHEQHYLNQPVSTACID